MTNALHIVEVPHESCTGLRFRFAAYKSDDGSRWVRHGLFQQFHENGQLASEGTYENDQEHGAWRDFHENGQLAAEGAYATGEKSGTWSYFDSDGALEDDDEC